MRGSLCCRRKRAEALEALRREEEQAMEARRAELLSDEHGYWRQRMMMEEQAAALGQAVIDDVAVAVEVRQLAANYRWFLSVS